MFIQQIIVKKTEPNNCATTDPAEWAEQNEWVHLSPQTAGQA